MPRLDAKTVGKTEARFDYLNIEKDNDNFEEVNNEDYAIEKLRDRGSLKLIDDKKTNQQSINISVINSFDNNNTKYESPEQIQKN